MDLNFAFDKETKKWFHTFFFVPPKMYRTVLNHNRMTANISTTQTLNFKLKNVSYFTNLNIC